jgi:hypothetical protein
MASLPRCGKRPGNGGKIADVLLQSHSPDVSQLVIQGGYPDG